MVPTHDHGELLRWSVRSALEQRRSPTRVVVIGDGVDETTRQVAIELAGADPRVEFLDRPKAPRLGEELRHEWMRGVTDIDAVCYLSDDDLLLPHHLERVADALRNHDFVAPLATWIRATGEVACEPGDAGRADFRHFVVAAPRTTFGLTGTSHTVEAYRSLPHGWRTTPAGRSTDHHMWAQWFEQPGLAAVTLAAPTVLHFPSPPRRDWSPDQRLAEIEAWDERSRQPGFVAEHAAACRAAMAEAAVNHLIRERWWELAAAHESSVREELEARLAEHARRFEEVFAEAAHWRDEAVMWRDEAAAQLATGDALRNQIATTAPPSAPMAAGSTGWDRRVGAVAARFRRRLARRP